MSGGKLISIRRMSLGAGFRYLMSSVAVGDGAPGVSNGLTRYYAESGTPPGVFLGAGLAGLADGQGVEKGSVVTELHLYRMLGLCTDPVTGEPLGQLPNNPTPAADGFSERSRSTPSAARSCDLPEVSTGVEGTDRSPVSRALHSPVAGFDLTFSVSKSASVAWAAGDDATKEVIYDCHRRAIDDVLSYAERGVFHSRSGSNGVMQEDIDGVVAASFTHWDSRAGDPQLHDHVVVLNRARSVSDGKWRTLDSRGLFKQTVALSELHHGVLSDLLTEALGWGWDGRERRHSIAPRFEVTGVSEILIGEFSQRADMIETRTEALIAEFAAAHGRPPSATVLLRLRQQATLETRPDKIHRSLNEMTEAWRQRAAAVLDEDPVAWVSTLADRNDLPLLRAGDLHEEILADAAQLASRIVASRRATFTRANILAEVHRQFHGVRFATPDDRVAVAERTAELALGAALMVSAPELHHTPERFRRKDDTSRFRAADRLTYTTPGLLEAEARLLEAARRLAGPTVPVETLAAVTGASLPGRDYALSIDQALAVEQIVGSARVLDVLVGPAGTGKSTTMAGLRAVWEAEHGPGSVLGLAPSAAAAEVLADELGIDTENLAKWLHEHHRSTERLSCIDQLRHRFERASAAGRSTIDLELRIEVLDDEIRRWQPQPGQLVIVDEASLAGTFALDELAEAAAQAGSKVLLTGDWAQLTGIEAGGMFRALVGDRDDLVPELSDVRRFQNDWEKTASVELRVGHETAIDPYSSEGRVLGGSRAEMLNVLYAAWKSDTEAGMTSLMIAPDSATVAELNTQARTDRVGAGHVSPDGLEVAGGQNAGVGDLVITRQNNRRLAAGRRWVKNGDCWTVTATGSDGCMTVQRLGGSGQVALPAEYVRAHVELGYATTTQRAQGRTVASAHAMVSPTTTREALYVSVTRGRQANFLYVDTHWDPDPQTSHGGTAAPRTAKEVLVGVLRNEGADLAAHDMIRRSQSEAESILRLCAEYQTIAKAAQADRWEALLERCGLTDRQLVGVRASQAHAPLLALFRHADARGLDVEGTFPLLVAGRPLDDAADIASVLHRRVDRWVERAGSSRRAQADSLIVGLIPKARGVTDPDMQQALTEREQAMEQRAFTLAEQAIETGQPWVRRLGTPPSDPARRIGWLRKVCVIAAYRDRWSITGPSVIGRRDDASRREQLGQHKRAQAAIDRALALTSAAPQTQDLSEPWVRTRIEYGVQL
jgi:conjugative relaxase-like TrwC/TraI family protein